MADEHWIKELKNLISILDKEMKWAEIRPTDFKFMRGYIAGITFCKGRIFSMKPHGANYNWYLNLCNGGDE